VLFDLVGDEFTLGPVSVLEQRLQQTTSIVLVQQILVLVLNHADSLSHECMLLIAAEIFLLKHKFVVDQTHVLHQVRDLLLLTSRWWLHWLGSVLFDDFESAFAVGGGYFVAERLSVFTLVAFFGIFTLVPAFFGIFTLVPAFRIFTLVPAFGVFTLVPAFSLKGLLLAVFVFIAWLFCVANSAVAFPHSWILVCVLFISFVSTKVVVVDVSSVVFRFLFPGVEAFFIAFFVAFFSALSFVFHYLLKQVLI